MGRQKLSRTIDLDGVGQLSRGLVGLVHQAGGPKDVDDVLPADQLRGDRDLRWFVPL